MIVTPTTRRPPKRSDINNFYNYIILMRELIFLSYFCGGVRKKGHFSDSPQCCDKSIYGNFRDSLVLIRFTSDEEMPRVTSSTHQLKLKSPLMLNLCFRRRVIMTSRDNDVT